MRVAAGVGIGATLLTGALLYSLQAWQHRPSAAEAARQQLSEERVAVAALPYAGEVVLQPDPERSGRVKVEGFLPKHADLDALAQTVRALGGEPDVRVLAVDDLQKDLAQRFSIAAPSDVRYERGGRFMLPTHTDAIDRNDRDARTAMQEIPGLNSIELEVQDVMDDGGQKVRVAYSRVHDRMSELDVRNLDIARQRLRYVVREVRLGTLPSVVLDNGARYFEGARLPDGAWLQRIEDRAIVIRQGDGEHRIVLPETTSVSVAAPVRQLASPALHDKRRH